jgi:hypothetical protein
MSQKRRDDVTTERIAVYIDRKTYLAIKHYCVDNDCSLSHAVNEGCKSLLKEDGDAFLLPRVVHSR